jgi:hypothetical protein
MWTPPFDPYLYETRSSCGRARAGARYLSRLAEGQR